MVKRKQAEGKAEGKEIPIPGIYRIATYEVEYLPTFRERNTYLRGRGGTGYDDATYTEYDIDAEDARWLAALNRDQERLSLDSFEAMLWKLDVACAEATDKVVSFSGSTAADRITVEACATTDHLQRDDALQMLHETCPARDTLRAAVYDYWLDKRRRLGRPLLRRLQAPTPLNNNDPYRVFRPREKVNRPQTRRRRENNQDSLEKLVMIRQNVGTALQLFELLVRRERKKRDMTYVVTDWQQLQLKQRHEPRAAQEAVEAEYQAAVKNKNPKRPVGFEKLPEAAPAASNALLDFRNKKNKKRKKLGLEAVLNAVAQMPPPPLPPQPAALFASAPEPAALEAVELPKAPSGAMWRARLGRGGRLIFDRCRAITMEPLDEDDAVKPIYELPNRYAAFLGKADLAAVIKRLDGGDAPGGEAAAGGANGGEADAAAAPAAAEAAT
jgi:enhancer of polycomb-like protein